MLVCEEHRGGPYPGVGGGFKEGFLVEVVFTQEVFLKEVIYTWEGCKEFKVSTHVRLGGDPETAKCLMAGEVLGPPSSLLAWRVLVRRVN